MHNQFMYLKFIDMEDRTFAQFDYKQTTLWKFGLKTYLSVGCDEA
jgi:hypothetical protein